MGLRIWRETPAPARWLALLGLTLFTALAAAPEAPLLHTDTDRLSYALGMDLGHQLRRLSVTVGPELFARGLADGLAGGATLMSDSDARAAIAQLQETLQRRAASEQPPAAPTDAPRDPQ